MAAWPNSDQHDIRSAEKESILMSTPQLSKWKYFQDQFNMDDHKVFLGKRCVYRDFIPKADLCE